MVVLLVVVMLRLLLVRTVSPVELTNHGGFDFPQHLAGIPVGPEP